MANAPVALVTGATRLAGIGAAICRQLAADGFAIAFAHWTRYDAATYGGNTESDPELLEQQLRELGADAVSLELDLAGQFEAEEVFRQISAKLGPVTVLVNNAAYSTNNSIDDLTCEELDAHYAVNVRGMAMLSQAFVRQWGGGPGGRIINMTSGQSQGPMPNELAYAASKGAVEAFTVSLAAGVADRGITVNAVNPGPTDTGWMDDELKVALLPRFPMGRIGTAEDAARLVAFLASPQSQWITGQVIHSEGGFQRG